MNKKLLFFKYDFIVFLYAYLRQTELSMDRSRWSTWTELKEYYKKRIAPGRVAMLLLTTAGITPSEINEAEVKRSSGWQKFKDIINRIIFGKCYMKEVEILYCYQQLMAFEKAVNSDIEQYNMDLEKLRVNICLITYNVIKSKLPIKRKLKAQQVEHYNQNRIGVTIPISEFSKGII
jgi:hypothetical protein